MKKILSLMALLLLTVSTAWADTATVSYNNSEEVSDPEGFFTHDTNGKFNINTKFTDAEYDGISFTSGLKMEGSTKILFTTTKESTVTIVQSTWSSNTIKFDGGELSVNDAAAGTGCRIYTIENVAAGDHNITRGSGESGIFYVKAEWADAPVTKTVYFDKSKSDWENVYAYAWYNDGTDHPVSAEWPGDPITVGESGMYEWTTTGAPTKIIFNNGSGGEGNQTANLDFVDGATYNANGQVRTVTFTTDAGWTDVWAYVFSGEGDGAYNKCLGDWPGTQMTSTGEGTWTISFGSETAPEKIIFHNNEGNQTPNLGFVDGKAYEYMQNTYTATFTTDAGWEHVYAYVWTTKDDKTTVYSEAWPGTELTANEGVYTVTINTYDDAPQKIQFNGGTNETKAGDWNFVDGKAYKYFTATPIYALTTGVTFTSGQTIDVIKDEEVVATLTYGEAGGNDFNETKGYTIEGYTGYTAYTAGNGENGDAEGGTFYTIVPKYDGIIDIAVIINKDKTLIVEEDGVSMGGFEKQTEKLYGIQTFNVKAGKSYKCYVSGSKLGFFGFDYKFPEVEFKVAGTMTGGWSTPINVRANSYTFENLAAGTYQFKVLDGEAWKGIADMTEVAGGLYWDSYGNVCFKLAEESNVTVNYKSGELFTVEGNFVAPTVALAGSMNEWSSTANVLVPAEDKKTASVTVALNVDYYQLKMIVDGSWLAKNALYELTRENSSVEHVDQAIDDGPNIAVNADVAGDYTFTWEYATNTLTVTYPEKLPTVALAGTMNSWSATADVLEPAEDKQTASITLALNADEYEFKMVVDNHWLAKDAVYVLHRGWRTVDNVDQEISMGPNIKLQADVAGDYTFTWEYATNTLTVTFPTGDLTLYEDADNTAALTKWDGTSANVTLTRTLKTGMWNTFAAPFSIEIPTGWTVKELIATSYDAIEDKVTMTFADAEGIVAGKPYLVKVNTNDDLQLNVFSAVTVNKTVKAVTSLDYIDFIPTLGKTLVTGPEGDESNKDAVLFLAADNKLVNPTVVNDPEDAASYIKGFRAYFLLKDEAANARVFNLDLGEGETTSISEKLKVDSEQFAPAAVMYDLQGRRVQNAAQKGVYIMNGRKVVKK